MNSTLTSATGGQRQYSASAEQYLNTMPPVPFALCAGYFRFSTKLQESLEDQERVCREFASSLGWQMLDEHIYKDPARSGTLVANRPGLKALRAAAKSTPRKFDYILVPDTSRLSRNIGDIFNLVDEFKSYGVEIYFVEQKLDSRDPNFRLMLSVYSIVDESQVTKICQKSREAIFGRVMRGFVGGSWPYGYRGVRVLRDTSYAFGQDASYATALEVIEEQAVIVRRIMEEYADGRSVWEITLRLNADGIPWPPSPDQKWNSDAVKRTIHNELYIGVYVLNKYEHKKNRETGRVIKKLRPVEKRLSVPLPHLRIVEPELWDRVQARLNTFADKQNARRLAGWKRAKNAVYPYSGRFFCGLCGSRMRIGGVQGRSVYECPMHRARKGCTNSLRIPEKIASAQITDALVNQILVPETMDWLVASVFREMKNILKQESHADTNLKELEERKRALEKMIGNAVEAIIATGSESLRQRLKGLEQEKEWVERRITGARNHGEVNITEAKLRDLVLHNVANLQEVLKSDVTMARELIQRHVKKLSLFPGKDEGRPVFAVVGEMDIFEPSDDQNDGVFLEGLGTQTLQKHTVDRGLVFLMYLYPDAEVCPLVEPLSRLLKSKPELSLEPRTPSAWAELLREAIPEGPKKPKELGYGTVARCFWRHREQLAERLIVTKTPNPLAPQGHVYQLSLRTTGTEVAVETPQDEPLAA